MIEKGADPLTRSRTQLEIRVSGWRSTKRLLGQVFYAEVGRSGGGARPIAYGFCRGYFALPESQAAFNY